MLFLLLLLLISIRALLGEKKFPTILYIEQIVENIIKCVIQKVLL